MLEKLAAIKHLIGNTPVLRVTMNDYSVGIKLEYYNLFGSIKDRPAFNIVYQGIKSGKITENTVIIESSSGNFAISLANICACLGLKFIPVVDPNINRDYLRILDFLCERIEKVSERDATGGYLLTRIDAVKRLCREHPQSFWTNQYENPDNYQTYYRELGPELLQQIQDLSHVFIAVSSAGTLIGLSRYLKETAPQIKIIAVDIEGSVIFNTPPCSRYISGLGSSMVPPLLKEAVTDEVMFITHQEIISGCRALHKENGILAGGSSGAVYQAIKKYMSAGKLPPSSVVAMCCPDRGNAYIDTIYNNDWCENLEKREIHALS